jgi:hypothetical protein
MPKKKRVLRVVKSIAHLEIMAASSLQNGGAHHGNS